VFLVSLHRAVNVPSGGCEKIDFPDFIGVLFLKGNVSLDVSNRLEGILARSFSDSGSLVSEKSILSHRPVTSICPFTGTDSLRMGIRSATVPPPQSGQPTHM
jgi:hypothetical protein